MMVWSLVAAVLVAPRKPAVVVDGGPAPFVFTPKTGAPIELPNYSLVRPKDKTMWFEYQLEKRSYSLTAQITFAMESAGVPEGVRDRVFELPDEELLTLVNEWAQSVAGASVGES